MNKKLIIGLLLGWAVSIFLSPRDVVGFFRPKSA